VCLVVSGLGAEERSSVPNCASGFLPKSLVQFLAFAIRDGGGAPGPSPMSRMSPTSTTIAAFGTANDPCYVMGLAQSADGAYLAASLSTHVVKVYSRGEKGALNALLDLTGHAGAITDVSFPLPHEPWAVLSSSEDGTTRLWDCRASGKARQAQQYVAHFAKSHATSTLGGGNDHLVASGVGEKIVFWDRRAATGLEVFEESHSEDVTRVRFQPSRRNRLFTASVDGLACVFDLGGCPADINDEAGLLRVLSTETAICEVGFCANGTGAGEDDLFWCLTGNEEVFLFDAGASTETLGDLIAHVPDTRAKACHAAAQHGCAALATRVDYLVSCFSSRAANSGPLVVAGTQAGALAVFPIRVTGNGPGAASLGAPLANFEGGHVDIVRAFAPGSAPVTGAEDARVCVWGEWAAAAAGESSGGKAAREGSESGGSRRQSPY
jgi:hypothetical protein